MPDREVYLAITPVFPQPQAEGDSWLAYLCRVSAADIGMFFEPPSLLVHGTTAQDKLGNLRHLLFLS